MAGKTTTTLTLFSQKKLLGKAHTSNLKLDGNEPIGSAVQLASSRIFGESLPTNPSLTLNVQQGVGVGAKTVEFVEFDVVAISGTTYNATSTGGGAGSDSGESSQSSGPHGYQLQLKSSYETDTDDTRGKAGNGVFDNSKVLHQTLGALQIVPTSFSGESDNPYVVKIYKNDGNALGPANQIGIADNIDWQIDTFNGVLFVQDFDSTKIDTSASPPLFARAFIYVGDMLDDVVSSGGSGGSGGGDGDGSASYLVLSATGSLANERVFTPGTGITTTDAGANGNFTVGVKDSVVATLTSSVSFPNGISGSLTQLSDGTSYLVAGDNVTITSASNGPVTIGSITEVSFDTSPELGGQLVTGDHKIAFGTGNNTSEIDFTYNGGGNFTAIASVKSIDMFLDLNGGDSGQKFRIFNNLQPASSYAGGTNTDANAIFMVREEGNVFTKGFVTASMGFSGSLTQLTDGTSYIKAGSGISVSSASNGSITLKSSKEMVFNELLGGIANGTNTLFTLANTPFSSSEISIFVNGQLQTPPDLTTFQDYSVTGSNVYFTTGSTPEEGSLVLAMYNKVVS